MKKNVLFIALGTVLLTLASCNKSIYPDRSLFIKDGDPVPTVQLNHYKSVQLRPNQDPNMAVALAISGGGSRASNLGVGVMLGLEQITLKNGRNVLQEIDYLSTVSGGGFAGGAYINSLFEYHYTNILPRYKLQNYVNAFIQKDLKKSYLGAILKNYFNPKLWFTFADDGDALEKVIDNYVLGYKRRQKYKNLKNLPTRSITLGDLFIAKEDTAQVRFPMLFANGTVMDNMAIFPFSPDILQAYQICGCTHHCKKNDNIGVYDIPLSVGIKASGSFPVLISNTTLKSTYHPKRPYLHVVDGGLSDNYGYETALDVLKQDSLVQRKVIFIVDANNSRNMPTFSKKQKGRNMFKVYVALPASGLAAKSRTIKPEVMAESTVVEAEPIFFGFDALLLNNSADAPKKVAIKKEQKRLIEELKTNMEHISDSDLQVLYELLSAIGTKYTITPEEQELLLLGGQKIVFLQKDKILKALGE